MNLFLEVRVMDCIDCDNYKDFGFRVTKDTTPTAEAVEKRLRTYAKKNDPSIKLDNASDLEWNEDEQGYWGLYFFRRIFIALPFKFENIDLTELINVDYDEFFPCEVDVYHSHHVVREVPSGISIKGVLVAQEGEGLIVKPV